MVTTLFEMHPKVQAIIKKLVLAIDRGEKPDLNHNDAPAYDFGYVEIDTDSSDNWDYVLTDKGQEAALRWRKDDSHGGNAG